MPYRHQQFSNGEVYHLVMKAIDDNLLFKDIDDYYRGIFSIYEFDNSNPVIIRERRRSRAGLKAKLKEGYRSPSSGDLQTSGLCKLTDALKTDTRERLVDIFCFSFMPNHIHLLVRQIKDGGITKFMQKLGGGYGRYFNERYERKGYVFQNRFAPIHVRTDEQLKTIFVYIHANPISIIEPKWKEIGIKDPEKVIKFLENKYRWSSFFDFISEQNFPSVTEREFMLKVMGGISGCKKSVEDWVRFNSKKK